MDFPLASSHSEYTRHACISGALFADVNEGSQHVYYNIIVFLPRETHGHLIKYVPLSRVAFNSHLLIGQAFLCSWL